MNRGSILYVEDSEPQRKALKRALELRGFQVEVAGDVDGARAAIERLGEDLDVLVLDMRLEDPKWPQMTGADVAIEYFNPQTPRPPEFLINSAYSEVDYYKLALKLGVATYLQKAESRQEDLIRHVRALAIRRALSAKRPDAADRIKRIVEAARDRRDAIIRFCREELENNFRERLGAPFIFLLTEDHRTTRCAGSVALPEKLGLYETIQAMVFAEGKSARPFVIEPEKLTALAPPDQLGILKMLEGAAFLPLTISRDLRLSLGILHADREHEPLAEPPQEMATVLAKHLESAVIELFITILTRWAEHEKEQETKRRELIRNTAEFCLYTGRNMLADITRLQDTIPGVAGNESFEHLQSLIRDLHATGTMLDSLAKNAAMDHGGTPIDIRPFVQEVVTDLDDRFSKDNVDVRGDCVVIGDREELFVIILRVLQWLAQRAVSQGDADAGRIYITCAQGEQGATLCFEDRSRRMDAVLRRRLFDPFAEDVATFAREEKSKEVAGLHLPLFLAKMLVEVRYGGQLEDLSDELGSLTGAKGALLGHKFLLRFPTRGT